MKIIAADQPQACCRLNPLVVRRGAPYGQRMEYAAIVAGRAAPGNNVLFSGRGFLRSAGRDCYGFLTFIISHNAIIREEGIYASSWWSYNHKYCSWEDVTDIYYELGRIKTDSNEIYEHETPYVVIVSNGELILSFSTNERFSYLEPFCYQIERHGRTDELIDYIKLKTDLDFKEVVFDRNTNQYVEI